MKRSLNKPDVLVVRVGPDGNHRTERSERWDERRDDCLCGTTGDLHEGKVSLVVYTMELPDSHC